MSGRAYRKHGFTGCSGDKMYYTLVPVYEEKSRLFTPVDNHKVVMRPVISKKKHVN